MSIFGSYLKRSHSIHTTFGPCTLRNPLHLKIKVGGPNQLHRNTNERANRYNQYCVGDPLQRVWSRSKNFAWLENQQVGLAVVTGFSALGWLISWSWIVNAQ